MSYFGNSENPNRRLFPKEAFINKSTLQEQRSENSFEDVAPYVPPAQRNAYVPPAQRERLSSSPKQEPFRYSRNESITEEANPKRDPYEYIRRKKGEESSNFEKKIETNEYIPPHIRQYQKRTPETTEKKSSNVNVTSNYYVNYGMKESSEREDQEKRLENQTNENSFSKPKMSSHGDSRKRFPEFNKTTRQESPKQTQKTLTPVQTQTKGTAFDSKNNYYSPTSASSSFHRTPPAQLFSPRPASGSYLPPDQRNQRSPITSPDFNRVPSSTHDSLRETYEQPKRDPSDFESLRTFIFKTPPTSPAGEKFYKRDPSSGYIPPAQREEFSGYISPAQREVSASSGYVPPAKRDASSGYIPPTQRQASRSTTRDSYPKRDPVMNYENSYNSVREPSPPISIRSLSRRDGNSPTSSVFSAASYQRRVVEEDNLMRQIASLKEFLKIQKDSNTKLKQKNRSLELINNKLENDLAKSKEDIDRLEKNVRKKIEELFSFKEGRSDSDKELREVKIELKKNKDEVEMLREENMRLTEAKENVSQRMKENLRNFKKSKGVQRKDIKNKEEKILEMENVINDLKNTMQEQEKTQELQLKAFHLNLDRDKQIIVGKENELKILNELLNEKENEISQYQNNFELHKDHLEASEKEILKLNNEIQELKYINTNREKEFYLFEAKMRKEMEQSKHKPMNNDFMKEYRKKIITKQEQVDNLKSECNELRATVNQSMESERLLHEKLAQVQEHVETLEIQKKDRRMQGEMMEMMAALKEKTQQLLNLQEHCASLEQGNFAKDKQLKHFDTTFQTISQQFERLGAMKLQYEKEIEDHKKSVSHLKRIVTQKDKKINKLVDLINSNKSNEDILSNNEEARVLLHEKAPEKVFDEDDKDDVFEIANAIETLLTVNIEPDPSENQINQEIIQNDVKNESKIEKNISIKIDHKNKDDDPTLALIEKYETILAEKEMELNEKEMELNEQNMFAEREMELIEKYENMIAKKEIKLNEKYENMIAEREMELIEKYEEVIAEKDIKIEDLKEKNQSFSLASQKTEEEEEAEEEEGEEKSNQKDQLFIEKLEMIEDYEDKIENFKNIILKRDIDIENLKSLLPNNEISLLPNDESPAEKLEQKNTTQLNIIAKHEEDLANYEIQLVTVNADVASLKKDKDLGKVREEKLIEEIETYHQELNILKKKKETLELEQEKLVKEVEDYKSDMMSYENSIREFETKEKTWSEEAEKLKETKETESSEKNDAVREDFRQLEDVRIKVINQYESKSREYKAQIAELERVNLEYQNGISFMDSEQIEDYKSQIAEQQELIEELKDLIAQDSHSEELETVRQEISVKNKEIRQLNKDLKKKTNLVGSIQDKLSKQNQGYKSYLKQIIKCIKVDIDEEADVSIMQNSIKHEISKIISSRAKASEDNGKQNELIQNFRELQSDYEHEKRLSEGFKQEFMKQVRTNKSLQDDYAKLEEDLEKLNTEKNHKHRVAKGLEKKAVGAIKETQEYEQTLEVYRNELSAKTNLINQLSGQINELVSANQDSWNMNQKLESMLEEMSNLTNNPFGELHKTL